MPLYLRHMLRISAVLFFVWSNIATGLWLRQHGTLARGFAHFRATLQANWLLLLILTDAAVFTLCALLWLARDLRQRHLPPARRWAWITVTIVLGCPGLLLYLAARPPADEQRRARHASPERTRNV